MWKYEEIDHINIEISSLCNSICAWCPRYENMSPVVNKQLDPQYVTYEQFVNWFPVDLIKRIKHWTYSGDYGDAGTNPDLIKIFKYTFKHNPNASVTVNTNGGMRNTDFWTELGDVFSENENRVVIFSIDGLEDTNHIYRRNVKWDKVIENVYSYMQTGAVADWDYLVFKHNQHQVEEAQSLSKRMGFRNFFIKYPTGFEKGNMQVKDKDYNVLYEIEPVDETYIVYGYRDLNGLKAEDIPYEKYRKEIENRYSDEKGDIKCFSKRSGTEIRITSWGAVYPCSHFGHLSLYPRENQQIAKAQVLDILKDKNISLKQRSLKDILNDDPFEWVYKSWEKKSCLACWINCGVSKDKNSTMQKIFNKEYIYGREL